MGIITLFTGLVVLLTGIFVASNPGSTFTSVAFVVGLALLLLGFVLAMGYWLGTKHKSKMKHSWVLVDAVVAILIAAFILSSSPVLEISIQYVLGMWCLYSGVMRIVAGTNINFREKKINFIAAVGTGFFLALIGTFAFTSSYFGIFSVNEIVGIFIIMQGISVIELGINNPHTRRNYEGKNSKVLDIDDVEDVESILEFDENIFSEDQFESVLVVREEVKAELVGQEQEKND